MARVRRRATRNSALRRRLTARGQARVCARVLAPRLLGLSALLIRAGTRAQEGRPPMAAPLVGHDLDFQTAKCFKCLPCLNLAAPSSRRLLRPGFVPDSVADASGNAYMRSGATATMARSIHSFHADRAALTDKGEAQGVGDGKCGFLVGHLVKGLGWRAIPQGLLWPQR